MRKEEKFNFIMDIENTVEENLKLWSFNAKYTQDHNLEPFVNFKEFEEIPYNSFKLMDETLQDKTPHVVYTKDILISDKNIVIIGDLNEKLRELNRRLHLIRSLPISEKFILNHLKNIDFAIITENGYESPAYNLIKNLPIKRITEKQFERMFYFTLNLM